MVRKARKQRKTEAHLFTEDQVKAALKETAPSKALDPDDMVMVPIMIKLVQLPSSKHMTMQT